MASISRKYLIKIVDRESGIDSGRRTSNTALAHGTSINLLPMLVATKTDLNRISIVYLSEGTA